MIRRDVKAIGGWGLYLLVLLSVICAPSLAKDNKKQAEEAEQLLAAVRERIDLKTAGSPPFVIRAPVEIAHLALGKQNAVGAWTLTWESPLQWREEITFQDYKQVRVASQGKLWTYRNLPYEPLSISQLDALVCLRCYWTLDPGESAQRVKSETAHDGTPIQCVELNGRAGPSRCSDAKTLLPREIEPSNDVLLPTREEYSDYTAWGERSFPKSMRLFEGGRLVVGVDAQIEPAPKLDPSFFAPPPQAVKWDWCDNPEPAVTTQTVPPEYPVEAKQNAQQAVVAVYAVIQTDGSPSNLTIVRSGGREFDDATLRSVRQWRYRPAMCGNKPIVSEKVIEVRYVIR